nr:helix-turn-helix domain-containing protein [Actinomycetota bacterium]
ADAQRRLQGDFFDELAGGGMSAADAARGLARFGFAKGGRLMVLAIEGGVPDVVVHAATDRLSRAGGGFLISTHADGITLLIPADADPPNLGRWAQELGERTGAELRIGAGSAAEVTAVGRSLREARYALQVCRLEGWASAGFEQLGTYRLLLSMTDPDALRAFADAMLGPLDTYDRDHNGELVASLQAFLEHNARWESAAAQLFVHRHTLRYRMRKVEELTARDLTSSFDRMEFWLALRARDLMGAQQDA